MFERFHRWAGNIAKAKNLNVVDTMDVMEPLPLGHHWSVFTNLRQQYGIDFHQHCNKDYKVLLSVLETNKYVCLDGTLYDEVPEGFIVDGSFVFKQGQGITQSTIDEFVNKIKSLQTDIYNTPLPIEEVKDNAQSSIQADKILADVFGEDSSEDSLEEKTPIDYSWTTSNPLMHPKFKDLYKKKYKNDEKMLKFCRKLEKNVSRNHIVVAADEMCIVESMCYLPEKGGKYYPEYGVWFSKKYKNFILWLFKIPEMDIIDLIQYRPPWKWIDVDRMTWSDVPQGLQSLSFLICGSPAKVEETIKYLKKHDIGVTLTIEKNITGKSSIDSRIYKTPLGKYFNIDTKEYVDDAEFVDTEYHWCTDDSETFKNNKQIRHSILTNFIKDL